MREKRKDLGFGFGAVWEQGHIGNFIIFFGIGLLTNCLENI